MAGKQLTNEIPFNETAEQFLLGEPSSGENVCEICKKAKLGTDEEIRGGKLVIGGIELDAPIEIYCRGH
ncbi:MAG: hypothetical protein Q8P07_04860 [bacterium]|nr:hypothetical protein [bacterium]